jgi:hypothetical protein
MWFEFCSTEAVINRDWAKPNYDLGHLGTRLAAHGFHRKICQTKGYGCDLCDSECGRCRSQTARARLKLLTTFAEENRCTFRAILYFISSVSKSDTWLVTEQVRVHFV